MASLSPNGFVPLSTAGEKIAPQHFHPPTPREIRAQALHRLQIGVLGLAAMLLLVGLANIIMDRARVSDEAIGPATATAAATGSDPAGSAAQAGDPLADIGVVPDMPADSVPAEATRAPATPASGSTGRR